MRDDDSLYVAVFLLMIVVLMVLYIEWLHQGEIDLLHERVDAVDGRPVTRILRAPDDATAEQVAKEGT